MASPIYGTAFLGIRPDLKGFGASLTRGVAASTTAAGNAGGSDFGKAFVKGVAAIGIGRLIVGQITGSIDESIKFESAFAGVLKTVDATVGQLDQLRSGIIDMAKVLPASREEIAGVAEAAGQLGIQTEAILDFTKVMIDLGETTDLTADQAATAFAQIANVMQTPQTMFENMASALVDLGNKGASTESQIIDFAQRIAGAGEIAGLAEADVLGIGSAMASVGIEAEAGGTAVQKVLLGITEAVATTNDDLEVFAQTAGLSAQAFAKAWEEDAAGAFTLFVEGLARAGDGAFQILEELDLQDQRLIRSFLSLSNAGGLLREQIEIGTTAWDDNTAAATEANKRYETSAARLEVVKNRATELQRQFGDRLVPIIVDLAEQHLPALENAFADVTTSMPGQADAQDFINFLSDVPRGIGVMTDLVKAQSNTLIGIVEGFSAGLSQGLVGDLDSALNRVTGAWEDFGQNALVRDSTQAMVQALREGEDSAVAFTTALERIGRRGKIDPKIVRTLAAMADVDPSQLVIELERLVELGPELGLEADEVTTLINALTDLGPPSIEAVRQANLLARGAVEVGQAFQSVPLNLEETKSAFTEVFLAAAEADIGLKELVDGTDDTGNAILDMLSPADQLVLKLRLVKDGLVSAADAFHADLQPALIDIGQGLEDLNKDGKVSIGEFVTNLEAAADAFLDFKINLAAIAGISPELAAALASLPDQVQAALLAEGFADADESAILAAAEAFIGDPDDIANALLTIYLDGLQKVDGTDRKAVDAWLDIIDDTVGEDIPGATAILGAGFDAALFASFADIDPPPFTPIVEESIDNMSHSAITASLDKALFASMADVELPDTTDKMTASIRGWDSVEIATQISALFEGIGNALDFSDEMVPAGRTMMDGIIEGVSSPSQINRLHVAIEDATNTAIEARSPSRLFLRIGGEGGEAFWDGFFDTSQLSTRQIAVDPQLADLGPLGVLAGQTFTEGFAEEIRRFEGQFSLGEGFDQLTAEQVLSLNLDPATQVFTGFDPLTVAQLQQLVDEALGTTATEIQFDFDLQALQEQLAALAEIAGEAGDEARAALMVGLSTLTTEEITRLRASILDTVNNALDAGSPSRLFLSVGEAAGNAFWSGFADVNDASVEFDGQNLINKFRQVSAAVSFGNDGGSGGGVSIGNFSVNNPIGEPTEESVQSALLEVAISPIVNRLVSAGSSQ